jgi:hypothetical protein
MHPVLDRLRLRDRVDPDALVLVLAIETYGAVAGVGGCQAEHRRPESGQPGVISRVHAQCLPGRQTHERKTTSPIAADVHDLGVSGGVTVTDLNVVTWGHGDPVMMVHGSGPSWG